MKKIWVWIVAGVVATVGIVFGLHVTGESSYGPGYDETPIVQDDGFFGGY